VYRGFDERRGVDVAWSKIEADDNHLSRDQMHRAVEEMSTGLGLEHPHVIKSFQCWEDTQAGCINMVTEFFTSGNLRDYRRKHKSLDIKAMKKWARQILQGLAYLHQQNPPVVHGDLRPDKIYINGHSGEIKIGDLGLAVLVPKRFAPGVMPEGDLTNQYTRAVDIFAFGLVMLELVTMKKLDKDTCTVWQSILDTVADPGANSFIGKCLAPVEERPSALELLKDPFLQVQKPPQQPNSTIGGGSGVGGQIGGGGGASGGMSSGAGGGRDSNNNGRNMHYIDGTSPPLNGSLQNQQGGGGIGNGGGGTIGGSTSRRSTEDQQRADCEAGSVRGEDYLFQFTGKIRDGKLHFRLNMHYEGDDGDDENNGGGGGGTTRQEDTSMRTSKTIDFVYDPEVDTPDEIAAEISSEFDLSPTDRDICAAALKEWLAEEGPDPQR
jgi:WNK lysine deficient protein kinase